MTPSSIITPISEGEIFFAHNPIVIQVLADSAVDANTPMYCDVYFKEKNNTDPDPYRFFKTLVAYTYDNTGTSGHGIYVFDIHNVCMDYINTWIPLVDDPYRVVNNLGATFNDSRCNVVSCFCSFRGSSVDGTGVVAPGGTVPIERALTSDPVSGSVDLVTNHITVLKASLTSLQNKIAFEHLDAYKSGWEVFGTILPNNNKVWNMSHYPANKMRIDASVGGTGNGIFDINKARVYYYGGSGGTYKDYDNTAFYVDSFIHGDDYINAWVFLQMCDTNGQPLGSHTIDLFGTTDSSSSFRIYKQAMYYLPSSPASIIEHAYSGSDDLVSMFKDTETYGYYYLGIADTVTAHANNLVWYSQFYKIGGPLPFDFFRVIFQNKLGCFESVAFTRLQKTHKNSSMSFYSPTKEIQSYFSSPAYPLRKQRYTDKSTGTRRANIKGWDEWDAIITLHEFEMEWFKELLDSAMLFALVEDPEAALWVRNSNTKPVVNYLPIVIADSDVTVKKLENTYVYEVSIKFRDAWFEVGTG